MDYNTPEAKVYFEESERVRGILNEKWEGIESETARVARALIESHRRLDELLMSLQGEVHIVIALMANEVHRDLTVKMAQLELLDPTALRTED